MKKDTVVELRRPAQGQDLLSTMLREGAQRLVAQAVQAEFEDFLTRDGMLAMIFKLGRSAEKNWRRLRGFQWLAKVISGVKFRDGIEVQQRVRKVSNQTPRRAAA